jgi:cytochrome b561
MRDRLDAGFSGRPDRFRRLVRQAHRPPPQPAPPAGGPSATGCLKVLVFLVLFVILLALPPAGVAAMTFWAWVLYFYRREKP